jgi:hypothetical protein
MRSNYHLLTSTCVNVELHVYILVNISRMNLIPRIILIKILPSMLLPATILPETSLSWRESSSRHYWDGDMEKK